MCLLITNICYARVCIQTINEVCTSPAETRIIAGFPIYKDCWQKKSFFKCYEDEYIDHCQAIDKLLACQEFRYECLDEAKDGQCNSAIRYYKCQNTNDLSELVYLDTEYTITDELDSRECISLEKRDNCHLSAKICLEGKETRTINGQSVTRPCWKWQETYSCLKDSFIDNCAPYEQDKSCALQKTICLSTEPCNHEERTYICMEANGQEMSYEQCRKMQYCLGNNCQTIEYEPDQDMGKALSYLHLAKDMGKEVSQDINCTSDSKQCQVFKGDIENCHRVISPGLTKNCCSQKKGLFEGNLMQHCPPSAINLANKRSKGLCHEVGSYCSNKTILGICLESKTQYCCFDSKVGRILQEATRNQLDIGWGTAKQPNCRAITLAEFERLDFSQVDLSDLAGDMHKNLNQTKLMDHRENIDQKIKNSEYMKKYKDRKIQYQDAISSTVKRHYGSGTEN